MLSEILPKLVCNAILSQLKKKERKKNAIKYIKVTSNVSIHLKKKKKSYLSEQEETLFSTGY